MGNLAGQLKPDGQKVTRTAPTFDWVSLPAAGRSGPPPPLPKGVTFTKATKDAWALLWKSPQATQWDQTGRTMHTWAVLHADLLRGERSPSSVSSEMRQIEDRHGLNPKALLQLRWRIVDDTGAGDVAPVPTATVTRLKVVDNAPVART